jgi:F-type H+-transporting ATPase subunit b
MASDTHTGTEAPAGGAGGLPQFDSTWWAGEIVWFCLIFAVVLFLMTKVFVPRVGGTIAEREDRISGDIARARALKEQAEAQAAAADEEMAQARGRAQKLASEAKARVQAEAAARQSAEEAKLSVSLAAAEAGIRASRDEAMGHVREIAADTAQAILVKLTGRQASAAEVKTAMAEQA